MGGAAGASWRDRRGCANVWLRDGGGDRSSASWLAAQVRRLLSDGCGPLYFGGSSVDLRSALARALEDLEL